MKEDFLHYLWKHKKFDLKSLKTTDDLVVAIKAVGEHNLLSGPDFFNAVIRIDNQLWAGNVEIHLKSSDWYAHHHENDPAYDNVILHVVWTHDTDVYRKDNTTIPVLELSNYVDESLLISYRILLDSSKQWINCENEISQTDSFLIRNWQERLYIERLETKAEVIFNLLKSSNNDWEAVLFKMLAKSFGSNVNGEAFLSIASSVDFGMIRKVRSNPIALEALLFGQASLLDEDIEDHYHYRLKERYKFLKNKFKLNNQGVLPVQFFRLRPNNFPTIRLSQLASLYVNNDSLFSKIIDIETKEDFYRLLSVPASSYWNSHYTFNKETKGRSKKLSKSFIDLLLINTIIPLQFCYAKFQAKQSTDVILSLIQEIAVEKNAIVDRYKSLKVPAENALHSQALIQLKKEYCNRNHCLQCAVGASLLE
ncbi:DUF2851 family protein [Spongiivirga sp. MCCC 1A20706]|uniref:DUF2851 family protein n=1 Tax=Spongiivirga sp. MCCC 1A20706 TaxID=3160963 RepID=UPI00397734F6